MDKEVGDTKHLKDYTIPTDEDFVIPIMGKYFEIKPSSVGMIQQNQLSRLPIENPNLDLFILFKFCSTLKANSVDQNVIILRLFPSSLRDRARAWL